MGDCARCNGGYQGQKKLLGRYEKLNLLEIDKCPLYAFSYAGGIALYCG